MANNYRVIFSDPSNVSMGAPLLSPVVIEGLSWRPVEIRDEYFHYNVAAVSGPWIALARSDVFIKSVNFSVYLIDTENRKIFKSKVFDSIPNQLKILGDKQVLVESNKMGFKTSSVVDEWQEI